MNALDRMVVTWSDTYATHIPSVDRQHQALVELISRLQRAMLGARTKEELPGLLEKLIEYTKFHFAWEEKLLEEQGYPDLAKQRAEHAILTEQVLELQRKWDANRLTVGAPVMVFLRHWLTDHIVGSDHLYAALLKKNGVE